MFHRHLDSLDKVDERNTMDLHSQTQKRLPGSRAKGRLSMRTKRLRKDHAQGCAPANRFTVARHAGDLPFATHARNNSSVNSARIAPVVRMFWTASTGDNDAKQQQNNNRQENQKSASPRGGHNEQKSDMSVREAGHKGRQRVHDLVEKGKQSE